MRIRLLWVINFVRLRFGGYGNGAPRAQSGNGRSFRHRCGGHSQAMVLDFEVDGGGSRDTKHWWFRKENVVTH